MSAPVQARDLRTKISASSQLIEKLSTEIQTYSQLPIIHGDLQKKVRALATVLYFLQTNAYARQNEQAVEKERLVLEEDLQSLNQR